jgi:hypothetical protein
MAVAPALFAGPMTHPLVDGALINIPSNTQREPNTLVKTGLNSAKSANTAMREPLHIPR